jgi:hypothetical protein
MIKHRVISFICLLTMLSGVGLLSDCGPGKATASIPKAAATPVATATPATTTYTSADSKYSLKYPTGWTFTVTAVPNSSGVVQFGNSGGVEQFVVMPFSVHVPSTANPALYPALLKDELSKNPTYFQNNKVDTTTTTVSYPAGVWIEASATTVMTGDPYVVRQYGIVHSGYLLIISTFAPSASAATDQTTYFAPMLTSFTFLR